ncbi:MAG TPA: leucyl/phenylalanyl-tRNA--protein transferase [Bacteroidales bacterium]|nr:leucyl/phenylalanyl-tRNA--protein transferase [Bacteroidales bacterium]
MPVFELCADLIFPHPSYAEEDGFLAYGGDLTSERIILAYKNGIFPWFNPGDPIMWWSPNPRCVLFPEKLKVSKSLLTVLKKKKFTIKCDSAFLEVIVHCAKTARKKQTGTWITNEIIDAYANLHKMGIAHSIEAYQNDKLVGGLYGLAIGKVFFGESMFYHVSDASKVAFCHLVKYLNVKGYQIIDNQMQTEHLMRFGSELIDRSAFLDIVKKACAEEINTSNWTGFNSFCSNIAW